MSWRRPGHGVEKANQSLGRINSQLSENNLELLVGGSQLNPEHPQACPSIDGTVTPIAASVLGQRATAAGVYGSWSDDVTFLAAGGSDWSRSPNLAYDTRLQNSETGEWALTTPTVQVRPDIQQSSDFMHYWSYGRSNGLPAPSRADAGSLGAYRYAMNSLTRPAWNAWASQNQGFYRDQGLGAGVIREPGLVFKRDDMRDLAAMGRFVWGGVKGTINGLAAVPQMVPARQAYLWSTGSDVWQPFEINGSVEKAGEFSFGIAGLFTGGGAVTATRSARLLSEAGSAGRAAAVEQASLWARGSVAGKLDKATVPNGAMAVSDASLPLGSKRLQMNQPKNPVYQPVRNDATNINGRDYSGHAIDRMQDRGIMPSVVQNTIDTGVSTSSRGGTRAYYDHVNNVSVVVNEQGKVVTVKYGR